MLGVYDIFEFIHEIISKDFSRFFEINQNEFFQNGLKFGYYAQRKPLVNPLYIGDCKLSHSSKNFLKKMPLNYFKKLNSASPYTSFAIIPTTPLRGRYYCKGNTGGLQKINTKHLDLEK